MLLKVTCYGIPSLSETLLRLINAVSGAAAMPNTLVQVRWPWIVLPLVNKVQSAIFLFITIIANAQDSDPALED